MDSKIEKNIQQNKPISLYPNKVGLFCNARDEKNMKEWAAHHLLLGFDTIIIFDHKSVIPLSHVFECFDPRVIIIRIDSNMPNIKNFLNNKAIIISKQLNLDWFIYLDADEFFILNKIGNIKFKNIKHFLKAYSHADSIGVNWLMFGSNFFVEDPKSGLLMENYKRSSLLLDQHVKSFVRPNKIDSCDHPHYYNLFPQSKILGIDFNCITEPLCFHPVNIPFYKAPAYIAHYIYQSEESYYNRKIRILSDGGDKRESLGKEIHNSYNNVLNYHPQRYVPRIKNFLSFWENKNQINFPLES